VTRRLLLVNPVSSRRRGLAANPAAVVPPLGLGIVATLSGSDWQVQLADENFGACEFPPADLVGLTALTPGAPRAYQIAEVYRRRGVPTVMGGIHASMLPEEALRHVDVVAVGEAESTWPQILRDLARGALQPIYREDPERRTPMSGARHDLFHPAYVLDAVQTARGCPMDCSFCSVTAFNGHRYRQRPLEDVLEELARVRRSRLYLVDDNLYGYGAQARPRALALFEEMARRGLRKEWLTQVSINFADHDDVLAAAARAGCRMVFLGLEASEGELLARADKRLNLRYLDRYEEVFSRIHAHGIAVLGGFIYGLEGDTAEALDRRTRFILHSGVDAAQLSVLTPMPGTRLFRQLQEQGRLVYTSFPDDWARYDMSEVVFRPERISAEELYRQYEAAAWRLYTPGSIWLRWLTSLWSTRQPGSAGWACASNLNYLYAGAAEWLMRCAGGLLG
jgi:radical SAM superfamily enzyme YgiQ (UPF0313 family)